jgi:hypothetical protein
VTDTLAPAYQTDNDDINEDWPKQTWDLLGIPDVDALMTLGSFSTLEDVRRLASGIAYQAAPPDFRASVEAYLAEHPISKGWTPQVIKGEEAGHPFRGNQYEEGESGPEERHFNLGGVPISKVPRNYVMGAGYSEQSEKSEPYYASNIKGCYTFDVGTGEANDPLRSGQIVLPPPAAEPVLRGSVEWDAYMATWSRVTFGNTVGRSGNLAYRMMDSAIARSTTTRDTVLYRGIAVSDASQYGVGATFRDMGYTSVTRDPALAEQFAELRATGSAEHLGTGLFDENRVLAGGEKIVFAIHVPAGSSTMAGDDSVKEFILPRGGTYTVTSYDPGTGLTHVDYKP